MMIKYVSFIVSLLTTVSCASSSNDGKEIAFSFSEVEESQQTYNSHVIPIPTSIAMKNEYALPFYDSDKSYLWDPQQFHCDLLEAFQALSIVENPNFPPYLKMLKFLSVDSPLAHVFRDYMSLNYCKPSYLHTQHQPLFWRSLIFSSFTDFTSISPQHSRQIIEQLQLLPSLVEVETIFVYGLLDDQFKSKNHFRLVLGWGHTSTVKLLLQGRTDISAFYADLTLPYAAKHGQLAIVKLLLQQDTKIYYDSVCCAIRKAVKSGYEPIADFLLLHRTDIPAYDLGCALKYASRKGRISTVKHIFQHPHEINNYDVFFAFRSAVKAGHNHIVEFLRRQTHIPAKFVG
jgi:hypothetical protein